MLNKKTKKKFIRTIGKFFIVPFVNVLCKTVRVREINKPELKYNADRNGYIFTFWHGTMLIPWYNLRKFNPCTIISQSKDGDLLSRLLESWNYTVNRGSSSRGGKEVLEELIKNARNNRTLAITPDGPRGPAKEMKAGAAIISKKSQLPVSLIGVAYKKKKSINSWDKFEIPLPFTRAVLVYSDPIYLQKDLTYDETDKMIVYLGEELNRMQQEAEQLC
jgi:lysophospholipid acyltransferase (LPLAT)-like uncharacterized protein